MNSPTQSKINITALITQVVTILFLAGVMPSKYETAVIAIIGLVMPAVVQIWRTWFTEKKER